MPAGWQHTTPVENFRELIPAMDTGQFHQSGFLQLQKIDIGVELILDWRSDLLHNLGHCLVL